MKLHEILSDDDQYALMLKLLRGAGINVGNTSIRNVDAFKIGVASGMAPLKVGRLYLRKDVWHFDIIDGQGRKLQKGSGDEQAALDFFAEFGTKAVKEELLSKDDRIAILTKLLKAKGFDARDFGLGWVTVYSPFIPGGQKGHTLADYRANIQPRGQGWEVRLMIPGRSDTEHRKRCKDEQEVIDVLRNFQPFTLGAKTSNPNTSIAEDKQDNQPLIWQLVDNELAKGKKVKLAAIMPDAGEPDDGGESFFTGQVEAIEGSLVHMKVYGRKKTFPMRRSDDANLTLVKDARTDTYWVKDIDHDAE